MTATSLYQAPRSTAIGAAAPRLRCPGVANYASDVARQRREPTMAVTLR
jgi:hypothetical protein